MDRKVSFRIRYERRSDLVGLLALALLVAALLGYLAWNQSEAAAFGLQAPLDHAWNRALASSAGMRQYYLTTTTHDGQEAAGTDGNGAGVCASGYHFASLWEILDPSSLKYNPALGMTVADSGQGPPTLYVGWVRTGYNPTHSNNVGRANCDAWTNSNDGEWGTYAYLRSEWAITEPAIHVWKAETTWCSLAKPVWCVEDNLVYLPIILNNSS